MIHSERTELLREAKNNLRVGLFTGLIGGIVLALLFATATLALNPELLDSVTDVLVLVLGLVLVYAVFCLILGILGAIGKTIIFLYTGRSVSDTKTAAFVTGSVFFLITFLYGLLWCRWHHIGGLSPERTPGLNDLPILFTIAGVAVLLARLMTYAFYLLIVHFKKPERRQPGDLRKAFFVFFYMAGAFGIFLGALHLTRPEATTFPGLNEEDILPSGATLVLVGIDGASSRDIDRLRTANRRGLPPDGAVELPVADPGLPVPPATWTLVATGQSVQSHGIVDYQAQVVRGLSRPFTVSPNQVGLFNLFQDVLPFFRLTRPVPMRSYMRGSKGLWNMAADAGIETAVVNWWVTWPAERIQGSLVSDHAFLRIRLNQESGSNRTDRETYPGSLLNQLVPLASEAHHEPHRDRYAPRPDASALEVLAELKIPTDVIHSDLFYLRTTARLLEEKRPQLVTLHLPGPDVLRRLIARSISDPSERQRAFDRALDAYWSAIGPALETCREVSPDPARWIWLSLPGWPLDPNDEASGRISLVSDDANPDPNGTPMELAEVAPTVLWMLGLPFAEEMEGSPRTDLLNREANEKLREPRSIASYGRLPIDETATRTGEMDGEMLELLRSLGYIDS